MVTVGVLGRWKCCVVEVVGSSDCRGGLRFPVSSTAVSCPLNIFAGSRSYTPREYRPPTIAMTPPTMCWLADRNEAMMPLRRRTFVFFSLARGINKQGGASHALTVTGNASMLPPGTTPLSHPSSGHFVNQQYAHMTTIHMHPGEVNSRTGYWLLIRVLVNAAYSSFVNCCCYMHCFHQQTSSSQRI